MASARAQAHTGTSMIKSVMTRLTLSSQSSSDLRTTHLSCACSYRHGPLPGRPCPRCAGSAGQPDQDHHSAPHLPRRPDDRSHRSRLHARRPTQNTRLCHIAMPPARGHEKVRADPPVTAPSDAHAHAPRLNGASPSPQTAPRARRAQKREMDSWWHRWPSSSASRSIRSGLRCMQIWRHTSVVGCTWSHLALQWRATPRTRAHSADLSATTSPARVVIAKRPVGAWSR